MLTDCAAEAAAAGAAKSAELSGEYLTTLADNGMTVGEPSEQLASDLQGYGETMTDEWIAEAGDQGQAIIDEYRAE